MASAVSRVEVASEGVGTLLVRWEVDGDPVSVDVAVGETADQIDHRHEATVSAGERSLRVERPSGHRLFVSVAPHGSGSAAVAGERRIPFSKTTNFRDIGGYLTERGRQVRWGRVFRSDALHGMSENDLALFGQLGVRHVFDLRSEEEATARPDSVPARNLPIRHRAADDMTVPTMDGTSSADGERVLMLIYTGHLDHAASEIGEMLATMAGPDGLPAVFHCHAGKDRTGIVAAVLLQALGVDRDVILDDYEMTMQFRHRSQQDESYNRLIKLGLAPGAAASVLGAPRTAMAFALDYIDREYGGIEKYLTGPARMTIAELDALADQLLV